MIKHLMAAFALATAWLAAPAWAFDTGPHATITEQAMSMAGYNRAAADAVQVENWLTDYYTSAPTFPKSQQCHLEKLHFDDVFTDADIDAYWKTLLKNTLAAAAKAKADRDYVELYVVLGVSLHVVQDFYAHSNWVESSGFAGPGFDTTTYFQWRQNRWRRNGVVHTGWYPNCLNIPEDGHPPHGGYSSGMNHDSVVRPDFNRAYVYGLAASVEWLAQVQRAVAAAPGDPDFATRMLSYSPAPPDAAAMAYDQRASLFISEWIQNPLNLDSLDGHWNGNHSGYLAAFTRVAAAWIAKPDSLYVRTFKQSGVYVALAAGLYAPYAGADPPFYPTPVSGTVIDMRTRNVCANYGVGTESYFGSITPSNGLNYPLRDAAQIHRSCVATPWEYLAMTGPPAGSISLTYSFWNEQGLPSPGESAVPINGGSAQVLFHCAIPPASGGCVWGDPGGRSQPMPPSLNLKGSGFKGVALSGISIQVAPGAPWRPS
jgi:hypothetical protein